MSDFGQTLLAKISKRFSDRLSSDQKIRQIARRVRDGTSYEDAQEYAQRLGELLSEAMRAETGTLSYMSEEVAREVLFPLLGEDHDLACEAVRAIQSNMYREIGVGLNPVIPELDTGRIEGLVDKISGYTEFSKARWLIDEPIVNFSQSVIDQAIRDNAKKASQASLAPRITRKAEPAGKRTRKIGRKSYSYDVPCEWCLGLDGTWEYGDEPDDVYRRHAFCRCVITYRVGKRYGQDVWNKKEWNEYDAKAKREQIADMEKRITEDQTRLDARKLIDALTIRETGARKILIDYHDEIARNGLDSVIAKLSKNQKLLNEKYR